MPSSIHEHPEEWLAAALADGLSPEESRVLDEHLADCERCRALQADFAALDETLLRDFPLAVGPDGGFYNRLVAGFRRRRGQGGRLEKLRALAAWLLRQRGAQFAGVAAALLSLISLGRLLTDGGLPFGNNAEFSVTNSIQVREGASGREAQTASSSNAIRDFAKDGEDRLALYRTAPNSETLRANVSPEIFLGSVPGGDIDVGRDVTAGFGEIQVPVIGPDMHISGERMGVGGEAFYTQTAQQSRGAATPPVSGFSAVLGTPKFTGGGQRFQNGNESSTGTSSVSINGLPSLVLLNGRTLSNAAGVVAPSDVQDQRNGFTNKSDGFADGGLVAQNQSKAKPVPSGTPGPTANPDLVQPAPDRVVITGSNIPTSEEVGTAPVDTVDQAARNRTGQEDVRNSHSSEEVGAAPVSTVDQAAASPASQDVRKLIRNASAELEVASFDAAVDAVTIAAKRDGGFLDTRNSERGGNGKVSGSLVVKVLPEHLDRFLVGLRAMGDVKNQTVETEDVTKDYFDTDARLRNSRRMEERLLKMLSEVKGKLTEILQVEKELARVRGEIETMQGQLKLYDAQVRYATVTLDVREKDLNQPAAFLLRETATLSLLAADVERTAAEVRRVVDAAHAQTVRSEVTRDPSGKSRATLRLLIAPEASADVIAQIKALGRVENFHVQNERVAQNGSSTDAAAQDPAKVERAPVTLDLTISHDEQISRQVSLTVVAGDVERAFEKARAAAVAAGGEIVESNVTRPSAGHANAVLGVRVPAAASGALLASFQSLGRAGEAETRRVGTGPEADAGPVLIRLSVVDAEPAVQQTVVRVQTAEVERRAGDIKREAAASHATVEESNFASEGDGRQRAGLRFRLPMSAYAEFIDRVRALGTVKDFTVQRNDRPARTGDAANANAPVVVDLLLYSEGRMVAEESGLSSTLRRTFGQGAGALMWSVRMIGVAVAFLAPWAVLAALGIGAMRWRRRSKDKGN